MKVSLNSFLKNQFKISFTENKKILFVVNELDFFLSHRLDIGLALQKNGYEVHIASASSFKAEEIASLGFSHHCVPFTRSGQNIFKEFKAVCVLIRLLRSIKPALIHLVTIKPILYGGLAAQIVGIKAVVVAISGLGTVFMDQSTSALLRRWFIEFFYKVSLAHKNMVVIFQNQDDRDILQKKISLKSGQIKMLRGSGVDLNAYPYKPESDGKCIVVMASRLLKDKGLIEYFEAARLLKHRGLEVEMRLLGSLDLGNPTSITKDELDRLIAESCINYVGFSKDIAGEYRAANIVCLPSYREGLPKSLVEAAACGRAVVTTDTPGCRDAIIPNVTGILVPVKSVECLADAIEVLVKNTQQRKSMGKAGRELAERDFSIEKIAQQHMEIYCELLKKST